MPILMSENEVLSKACLSRALSLLRLQKIKSRTIAIRDATIAVTVQTKLPSSLAGGKGSGGMIYFCLFPILIELNSPSY